MNLEFQRNALSRRVNLEASRHLTRKLEKSPIGEVTAINTGVLDNPVNKYIIGLFGPHKSPYDSSVLTSAVRQGSLARATTLLSRPPNAEEHTPHQRAIMAAKQYVSPLLHPIYTTRDTPVNKLAERNMRSFSELVRYQKRVAPGIVFIAPDGGASPNETRLDPKFTRAWGTMMLIASFLDQGVSWEELAVVPIGIRKEVGKTSVVFGENLTPAFADMYTASPNPQPWMDRELAANFSQGIVSSVNQLLI